MGVASLGCRDDTLVGHSDFGPVGSCRGSPVNRRRVQTGNPTGAPKTCSDTIATLASEGRRPETCNHPALLLVGVFQKWKHVGAWDRDALLLRSHPVTVCGSCGSTRRQNMPHGHSCAGHAFALALPAYSAVHASRLTCQISIHLVPVCAGSARSIECLMLESCCPSGPCAPLRGTNAQTLRA